MNSIIATGRETLRHELEQRIRAEVSLELGEKATLLQLEQEVKKRLKQQMPSSATLY